MQFNAMSNSLRGPKTTVEICSIMPDSIMIMIFMKVRLCYCLVLGGSG